MSSEKPIQEIISIKDEESFSSSESLQESTYRKSIEIQPLPSLEPVNFLKPESEIRNEVIYNSEYVNETIDTTKGAEPFEIIDSMTSEGYGQKQKK